MLNSCSSTHHVSPLRILETVPLPLIPSLSQRTYSYTRTSLLALLGDTPYVLALINIKSPAQEPERRRRGYASMLCSPMIKY